MAALCPSRRVRGLLSQAVLVCAMVLQAGHAYVLASPVAAKAIPQTGAEAASSTTPANALPAIPSLMFSVEAQQRAAEARQQDYIYRSIVTETESGKDGQTRKTETREYNVFWLRGVPVHKLIVRNGKPLSEGELLKEDQRIDKEVSTALDRRAKNDAKGKETDPRGDEEVTVSRILELGSFSNARRITRDGRATIAVDYHGDPKAKTRNRSEAVFRDLTGTVWVDEADREVVALEGVFSQSFKIAGGLLADIHEGTRFSLTQHKINGEAWMPTEAEANGAARLLFFSVHGGVHVANTDFRRFRATSTILPGVSTVEEKPEP